MAMQRAKCLARIIVLNTILLLGVVNHDGQAQTVERSSLFEMNAGDVIEDAGVITVNSERFGRTEAFEVVRRRDGGRTVTSVITGTSQPFRVEGSWVYNAKDFPLSAAGKGNYFGTPVDIKISVDPPEARVVLVSDGVTNTTTLSCTSSCLVDLAPSTVAMFTMTRRVPRGAEEPVRFDWIGQGLTFDQTLTHGLADVRELKTQRIGDTTVIQYLFVETLPNLETGGTSTIGFNLYVDDRQRPLAFVTQGGTVGARGGFETLTTTMPPVFDPK